MRVNLAITAIFMTLPFADGMSAADGIRVPLRLIARNSPAPPRMATLELRSVSESGAEPKSITLADGAAEAVLPAGSVWQASVAADGWWSSTATVTAGEQASTIDVWKTAEVRGRVSVEHGAEMPEALNAVVEVPPYGPRVAEIPRGSTFRCPIQEGVFRCALPIATVDLALRAKGFTPHYRWSVDAGNTRELAPVAFRRGASLVAWLERASAEALKKPARAKLVLVTSGVPSETTARLSVPVAEAEFTKQGYVQLAPLPAGVYTLEVSAPGFAKTVVSPIEIYEARESVFRKPIELQPPLRMRVAIDPPLDVHDKPWQLRLHRLGDFVQGAAEATIERTAGTSGVVTIDDQSPGRFRVEVRDSSGNRVYSEVLLFEDLASASRTVEIRQVRVRGKVTLNGKGVPAELLFGGRNGALRVAMQADDSGHFTGALPRTGMWLVEVDGEDDLRAVENLRIEEDASGIEIALADTLVTGSVVDVGGTRVPNAHVIMTSAAAPLVMQMRTDEAGGFRFRGVRPGRATLSARHPGTNSGSAIVLVQIAEGIENAPVELHLRLNRELRGQVVSRGEPVVGGFVDLIPMPSGSSTRATTDVTGSFRIEVPEGTTRARAVVGAPNRTLNVFEVPIGDEPLRFDIAPVGGDLTVDLPEGVRGFTLTQNGASMPFHYLVTWSNSHGQTITTGGRVTLPRLAPGQYRVCVRDECREGTLGPAATLTFTF